jgi:Tol biopolymer transport system component
MMRATVSLCLGVIACLAAMPAPLEPPVLVTVRQAIEHSSAWEVAPASLSADGRYIAFVSFARLSPRDDNANSDIYVLDRQTGAVTLETPPVPGVRSDRDCSTPQISSDGRYLAYETSDDDLTKTPSVLAIVMWRDRLSGTTRPVQGRAGRPNGASRHPAISGDGRIVAFASGATNLLDDDDLNGSAEDVYAYDVASGAISRVSVDSTGRQALRGASFAPSVSSDGRLIAFTSTATLDTVVGDLVGAPLLQQPSKPITAVFVRDTRAGVTTRASVCRRASMANGSSYDPAISADGRYVVFVSDASNLVSGDTNRVSDVFLHDMKAGVTTVVSRARSGGTANGPSGRPAISAAGDLIVFQSEASDMVCGRCQESSKDINLVSDVFLFSVATQTMTCLSTGRSRWMEPSASPAIDATGTVIAFSSRHPVDTRDVGNDFDLFVRFARVDR